MAYQRVVIEGNLGKDPEQFSAGCKFTVAVSEKFSDKSGQKQERTEWFRVVVFGNQAGPCSQFLSKGRPVLVEGRLRTESYDKKDGSGKGYSTDLIADRVVFLGGGNGGQKRSETEDPTGGQAGPAEDDQVPF
jgi:single-strand DNA-binding protein